MERKKRDFKGIWIPKEIWCNKELTWIEKIFLREIDSLDNEEGCFASNKYFADFFDLSKSRASQIISSLLKKKYIMAEYIREGKEIKKRVLRVAPGVFNKLNRGIKNIKQGYLGNYEDNNTDNNNTDYTICIVEIIDYLNLKAKKSYKYTTNKTKECIRARLREGFTVEECKKVIDIKVGEWLENEKMNQYLRPQTLFGTKFEAYLNQKIPNNGMSYNDDYNNNDEKLRKITGME